jgi:hypothetical protein
VTLSLFGIFFFTSPFLRVLAVLISARWVKVKGSWTTEGTVRFEYDRGATVQRIAQEKHNDHFLTRIRGVDLFVCEAQYHPSCRNKYCQNPEKWRSKEEDSKERQSHTEKAHSDAF